MLNRSIKFAVAIALMLQSFASASETEDDFTLGCKAYEQKHYAESIKLLDKYVASSAPNARATYYLALANFQSGNKARATQLFNYIVRSFPRSKEAQLAQSALARSAGSTPAPGVQSGSSSPALNQSLLGDNQSNDLASLPDNAEIRFSSGDGGHMMVDAYVNGHPIKCWFDTGANEYFGVNQLQEAGITVNTNRKPDSYTRGWAGRVVPIWITMVTLKVGNLTRTLPVAVSQQNDLLPLIGQGFVKDFQYSIDSAAGRMVLTKKTANSASSNRPINSLYDIPCEIIGDREFVTLTVNGRTCPHVLIDTGASNTILSYGAANSVGLDSTSGRPLVMTGVGGNVTMREVFADLRLGPISKSDFSVKVGGNGGSAIGQDFMSGWRFTVDREAKLLRFFH